ncbi:MAG: DEAD/DEAH box helicase family protein [Ignavibacteriaceae bacterium]|nr:DEAD/DEAH box helicase family protein [Ignavibacteriaceae bacterium]
MPQIFDNISTHLSTALKQTLEISHRSDFCVGYFNLRGWKQVANEVEKWNGGEDNSCRLLVGMQNLGVDTLKEYFSTTEEFSIDNQEALKIKKRLAQEFKDQLTIGIPTEADEIGLKKLAKQISQKKVFVKLFLRHPLHAKLYLLFREDPISPIVGYLGSSNLTLAGLLKQGELNVDVIEQDAAKKLKDWFEDRWNDRWCIDISEELIEILNTSWAADKLYNPYHVYLKMAYHLSREARSGINEFNIPKVFKDELLEFQQKAVLIAAHHLNKRNGVLVGDVVGLGKTMTASALAKIYEDDFASRILIICPKNLTQMWEDYVYKYELRAKVLSISVVQNELRELKRYNVVILDESHNLRNRQGKRYRAIQEYIKENDSKVILLTATPYNKTYLDLSNQLRLFVDDEIDIGISPERFIESVGGHVEFSARYQTQPRTLGAFERSDFADDWRELMRLYLVRRTRSFIKDNYAETDETKNRKYLTFADGTRSYFPDRTPKKVEYDFDPNDPSDQYAKLYSQTIVDIINRLELPRYGLANYLINDADDKASSNEKIIIDNLSRAGRRLIGFARTNLFKRLESSGYSFLLSINRHLFRNYLFIYAIQNNQPIPIGQNESRALDEYLDELDLESLSDNPNNHLHLSEDQFFEYASVIYQQYLDKYKNRFEWIRTKLFKEELLESLKSDCKNLMGVLEKGKDWKAQNDRQLNALYNLCYNKHKNEKVLIFTQYADTANYLFEEFTRRKVSQTECVTGDNEDPTKLAYRFSPISNEKQGIKNTNQEVRVLISTDVLSEGQNLQDAHIVINYDLPWAIIRLIQRAGRIDRIGQKAEEILCYSVLPEDGLEQIINLRGRLGQRIGENAEVVGSDETFFEGDPINIADLYNERSGILDDEDDGEVDLSSYAFQIWQNAIDDDPKLRKTIPDLPDVVYATKKLGSSEKDDGVIVYARTYDDNDILSLVDKNGNLVTNSQFRILKTAACNAEEVPLTKIDNHHQLVERGVEHIKDVESKIGGQLGRKTGARYRVYKRLDRYYEDNKDTLFVNDAIKRAIEDIYKYPLKEFARETFNRQLKSGASDEDIANLASSLREEGKLSIIEEDEEVKYKEPKIICSLGLKEKE